MKKQAGFILITTFIMILMLTVMVLGILSYNTTQTRIAANATDEQIAFQTAEGAINQATNNVLAGNYPSSSFLTNTNGLYIFNPTNPPLSSTINWSSTSAVITSYQGGSNAQAAYIVEQLPSGIQPGQNMNKLAWVYRVTARAVGASGGSPIILQTTIQVQQ